MCSRALKAEQGERNLTLIKSKPKQALTLEEMHEMQLAEQIEVEQTIASIIKDANVRAFLEHNKAR